MSSVDAASLTPALDLLNTRLPTEKFERDAALHHFSEVTAAASLNSAIFGGSGGAGPAAGLTGRAGRR